VLQLPYHQIYTLTIEDGGATRAVTLDDTSLTDELAPLIEFLQQRARPSSLT
jgi:hypothetical protein